MIRTLALCLLATPAVAKDGCRATADLAGGIAGGILVEFESGLTQIHEATNDPALIAVEEGTAPDLSRSPLVRGLSLYTFGTMPSDPVQAWTIDYGVVPSALPKSTAGARRSSDATAVSGGANGTEVELRCGPRSETLLAGCPYPLLDATVTSSETSDDPFEFRCLPTLGLARPCVFDGTGKEAESQVVTFRAIR